MNVPTVEPLTSCVGLLSLSLLPSVSFRPVQCCFGIFLFSPAFQCNSPSFSSSHWVCSLCCQLISFSSSFVSFTLLSHCGLCLCFPFSLCQCSSFFLFASFQFCDTTLSFFAGRSPFYLQLVFCKACLPVLFYCKSPVAPPPPSLFSSLLCSVGTSSSYLSILSSPFLHCAQPSLTRLCLNRIPPFSSSYLSINTCSLISSLHKTPPLFFCLQYRCYSLSASASFPFCFPMFLFHSFV